jgi:hypothetical protein
MNERGTPTDIARIEEHIEALRESIARCRKLALAARISIVAGAALLALTLLTLVPFSAAIVTAAVAAVIGGIVLAGSNATTWTQAEARLRASEAMRAEMIEQMDLRVVGDEKSAMH